MDPLSITASISALLGLTGRVVSYVRDTKGATDEMMKLSYETTFIAGLLNALHSRVRDSKSGDPWFSGIKWLGEDKGPLCLLKDALEQLESKISQKDGVQKAIKILTWSLIKQDVKDVLALTERLKSSIELALQGDQMQLVMVLRDSQKSHQRETSAISDGVSELKSIANEKQKEDLVKKIVEWLPVSTNQITHSDISSKRREGTGDWILRAPKFRSWLDSTEQGLICLGMPGAGKTVLASHIINHLGGTFADADTAVIHIYFHYKEHDQQSIAKLVSSLLKQLILHDSNLSKYLRWLFEDTSGKKVQPQDHDLIKALYEEMKRYRRVFIIIDALDECCDDKGARSDLLEVLRNAPGSAKWLVTSRHLPLYQEHMDASIIEVAATHEDVELYVRGRMNSNCNVRHILKNRKELQDLIVKTILEQCGGMFLLAKLNMDSLSTNTNAKEIRGALQQLPSTVEGAYDLAMLRIGEQNQKHIDLAHNVLMWVTNARRPLTLLELQHAVSIQPHDTSLDEEGFEVEEIFLSVCAGLVVVDETSGTTKLIHETAQNYFSTAQAHKKYFQDHANRISGTCIAYLSFQFSATGHCPTDDDLASRLEEFPFLLYTSHNWGYHAGACTSSDMEDRILAFLKHKARLACASQVLFAYAYDYNETEGFSRRAHRDPPPTCIAAYFGMNRVLERYSADELRRCCNLKRQALHYAADSGNLETGKLLLNRGVETNAVDIDGLTALHLAAQNGHSDFVQLLLRAGAATEQRIWRYDESSDRTRATPLHLATMGGHLSVIKELLDGKALLEGRNGWHRTPLHLAVRAENVSAIRYLIEKGADIEAERDGGEKPLGLSIEPWASRYEAAIALLERGANPISCGHEGTPLEKAIYYDHKKMVELFLSVNDKSGGEIIGKTIKLFFNAEFNGWLGEMRIKVAKKTFPMMFNMLKEKNERARLLDDIQQIFLSPANLKIAEKTFPVIMSLLADKGEQNKFLQNVEDMINGVDEKVQELDDTINRDESLRSLETATLMDVLDNSSSEEGSEDERGMSMLKWYVGQLRELVRAARNRQIS